MLRQGLAGMKKLIVPGVLMAAASLVASKHSTSHKFVLSIAIALPFIGFLWGLRVYEYSVRFSSWKDYLNGKSTLAEAFISIADRKIWMYMIPAAYFCGIVMGVIFYFLVPSQYMTVKAFIRSFSVVTYLLWIPACAVSLLFGANIFGPKPNDEEELALNVIEILNQSPEISPKEIESPSAIERFVNGATMAKGEDLKPYLWILSHIRSSQGIMAFRVALKSTDPLVRRLAVTYLGRVGGSDTLQLLQEHLNDETDQGIRQLIEDTLSRLTKRENV